MQYWHKDRHLGQRKRTETPEISPYIHGQVIFNKDTKTIQWGKEQSFFQQIVLGQLESHMQNVVFGQSPHTIHKMQLRIHQDLNIKLKLQNS